MAQIVFFPCGYNCQSRVKAEAGTYGAVKAQICKDVLCKEVHIHIYCADS